MIRAHSLITIDCLIITEQIIKIDFLTTIDYLIIADYLTLTEKLMPIVRLVTGNYKNRLLNNIRLLNDNRII